MFHITSSKSDVCADQWVKEIQGVRIVPWKVWGKPICFVCVCVVYVPFTSSNFPPSPLSRWSNPIWWCSLWNGDSSSSSRHCHLLHLGHSRHCLCSGMSCIQFHLQKQEVSYTSCCIHHCLMSVEEMFGLSQHTWTRVSLEHKTRPF